MQTKETKEIVIKLQDWADNIEAWQQNIYAFMIYGKDLLNYLKEKHPETVKEFMDKRKNGKGKITRGDDYPSMISMTDGKFFKEQLEEEKKKAQVEFLNRMRDDSGEYVEGSNGRSNITRS